MIIRIINHQVNSHMKKYILFFVPVMFLVTGIFTSCEDEEYERIQYLKKTLGPMIVGETYDFAFSVATDDNSVLKDVEIEASFPGFTGTTLDTKCYWTDPDGKDFSVEMLQNVSTNNKVTRATVSGNYTEYEGGYTSSAITVRYSYVIPEEARGNRLKFMVRYTTQNGSRREYSTEEYDVSKMDMVRDVTLTDPAGQSGIRYFSIADMKAYTLNEAGSKSSSIDFVYRYNPNNITSPGGSSVKLNHAFIAPVNTVLLNSDDIPDGWTRNNTCIEIRKWDDMQLKGAVPNNYVTDLDLENAELRGVSTAEYNLTANYGLLMQTSDGVYRAYVYVKSVNNSNRSVVIGVKRIKMK